MRWLLLLCILLILSVPFSQEGSFSYYARFMSEPTLSGYYSDGCVFDGPFRANGSVWLHSQSPGRDNDPWFQTFTLSSDHYLYGMEQIPSSEPQCGNLWIEPYELMVQGPPWFTLGADPLPFGPDLVDWQALRNTALQHGLFLTESQVSTNSRLLLQDGILSVKTYSSVDPVQYSLAGLEEPVVWIESDPEHRFYLKGHPDYPGFSESLTIGTFGHILFSGPLVYDVYEPGMLGLVSVYGDGMIASSISPYWNPPYHVATQDDLTFSASILLLDGKFKAENYFYPVVKAVFTLYGGMQMVVEGYTGTVYRGYDVVTLYDQRLAVQQPPAYPQYSVQANDPEHSGPVAAPIVAHPNPFSSAVTVDSNSGTLAVHDVSGRCVSRCTTNGRLVLDFTDHPAGLYFVTVVEGSGAQSNTLMVKL